MNKEESLRSIRYIKVPKGMRIESDIFRLDQNIMLPVQLAAGETRLTPEGISLESIVSGMLTIIAYDENHKDASYFKDFVLTVDPMLPDKLNKAAIAKEEQKDYEFAEELFLAVYHLMPQSASCINLATLYSAMAVDARDKGDEEKEDEYLLSAKRTLKDGLRRFGENADILAEIASYEAFTGNLEEAKDYLDRYMAAAEEGEKKQEMKKLLSRIEVQLENDEEIKEAIKRVSITIQDHDASKYGDEEFDGYREKYYPTAEELSDPDFQELAEEKSEIAWIHHYKHNWHHPMYWVDDETGEIKDMSLDAIIEMICDWIAMDMKYHTGVIEWYENKAIKEKKSMNDKTKSILEELLYHIIQPRDLRQY